MFLEQSSTKKDHTLLPDNYEFPFEMTLPSDLPESVERNSYGEVSYRFKAVAARYALSSNIVVKQNLQILREAPATFLGMTHAVGHFPGVIRYELVSNKAMFRKGEKIPIELYIVPDAPNDGWRVQYISGILKEYTNVPTTTTTGHHHHNNHVVTENRILRYFRDEAFPCTGQQWHKTEEIPVPRYAQYDASNPLFSIEHKIQLTMCLMDPQGLLTEVRAALPVVVANDQVIELSQSRVADEEEFLPTYEDARLSRPYFPLDYNTPVSSAASTPTDELDDWLTMPVSTTPTNGMPTDRLCRVPSYNTAVRSSWSSSNFLDVAALPSYESLADIAH